MDNLARQMDIMGLTYYQSNINDNDLRLDEIEKIPPR